MQMEVRMGIAIGGDDRVFSYPVVVSADVDPTSDRWEQQFPFQGTSFQPHIGMFTGVPRAASGAPDGRPATREDGKRQRTVRDIARYPEKEERRELDSQNMAGGWFIQSGCGYPEVANTCQFGSTGCTIIRVVGSHQFLDLRQHRVLQQLSDRNAV
jgi:hypothetical protein